MEPVSSLGARPSPLTSTRISWGVSAWWCGIVHCNRISFRGAVQEVTGQGSGMKSGSSTAEVTSQGRPPTVTMLSDSESENE